MQAFVFVVVAQLVSFLGSQLAGFGLGVWLYQRTGSVSINAAFVAATMVPQILGAPVAGLAVDRYSRRAVLVAGHVAGAVLATLLLVGLQHSASTGVVLALVTLSSCARAAEMPAFSAVTTTLVPEKMRGNANGIIQLAIGVPQLVAPIAAGALLPRVGIRGLVIADVASFVAATALLLCVRVPTTADAASDGRASAGDLLFGLRYIRERRGLFKTLLFFAAINFNFGVVIVLLTPLVLGFADAGALGLVLTVGGVGMFAGGVTMSAWGGPRRKIVAVLGAALAQGLVFLAAAAPPSVAGTAACAFVIMFFIPIMSAANETIWQNLVPAQMQGRVFSFRALIGAGALPFAFLVAGPLADRVFDPAMREGGALAGTVGALIGVGPGRGAALFFLILAAAAIAEVLVAASDRELRRVEDLVTSN